MIHARIDLADRQGIPKIVFQVLDYLKTLTPENMPKQSIRLEELNVGVNFADTTTQPAEERVYEAHRQMVDLHFDLLGTERITLAWEENLEQQKPYDEAEDCALYRGPGQLTTVLRPGEFLLCFPGEAHQVLVTVDQPTHVCKAIAKIPVEQFQ